MMCGTNTQVNYSLVNRVQGENVGRLSIHPNGRSPKDRFYTVVTGLCRDNKLGVYNNSIHAIGRAITERYMFNKVDGQFVRPPQTTHASFKTPELQYFQESVLSHMRRLPRLSRHDVVARYTGAKRRLYQNALDSLYRDPITRKDARLSMFVKFEKQNLEKAPRGINPRSPRYNLELGTYLKHAEKPFYKAINRAFGAHTEHTVIKGLNVSQTARVLRAKWELFTDPVAIGLDASKFDMHVSVHALLYEHQFYKSLFPGDKFLQWLLKLQLRNGGVAYAPDGKVKFSIAGTRCSGDLNTSLGNCLLMCSMVYAYARTRLVNVELANNGDDCVVFLERSDMSKFLCGLDDWFRDRGFNMTTETPVYDFVAIEFCQARPINTVNGWVMVRNHSAVVTKDAMCLIRLPNNNLFRKWMYAVGECGSNIAAGVPVQSAFYECFMRSGVKCSSKFTQHIFKNTSMMSRLVQSGRSNIITDQARVDYYYAFGITPDCQLALENYFATIVVDDWTAAVHEYTDGLYLQPGVNILQL